MTKILLFAAVLGLAACATNEQQPASSGNTGALEPLVTTPSATHMGRDDPAQTYRQPALGPERRLEPPPPPRRQ